MILATASNTVKFHEFPSGTVVHNYQPGAQGAGHVRSISWSKDGNWLAIVPYTGHTEIVSVKDQLKLLHTIQTIENPSCATFQHGTKKHIAVGTKDGQVLIYDIKSRNIKKRFSRATSEIIQIEITVKDQHVVTAAANDRDVHIYSNTTNTLTGKFKIPKSQSVNCIKTNPITRNHIAGGSAEGVVAVWDLNVNKTNFFTNSHNAPVSSVIFSPINAALIASTGFDRLFCFYDLGSGKKIADIFLETSMVAADFSTDGNFIATASQKGRVFVYDSRNLREPIHTFTAHNSSVKHLSFRKSDDHTIDTSVSSVIFEPDIVNNKTEAKSNRHNSDSFTINVIPPTNSERTAEDSKQLETTGDSFMVELGLDRNTTNDYNESSIKSQTGRCLRDSLTKLTITTTPSLAGSKALKEKLMGDGESVQKSSTPTLQATEMSVPISPLISQNKGMQSPQLVDVEAIVTRVVRAEMKSTLSEIQKMLNYQKHLIMADIRQLHYHGLVDRVKESIKTEDHFNAIHTELAALKSNVTRTDP